MSDAPQFEGWFYRRDGEVVGPLSRRQLRELADAGELHPRDALWRARSPDGELTQPTRLSKVLAEESLVVLLVGNPRALAADLGALVRRWGYGARLSRPGAEAQRAAGRCEPDLVLVDLDTPGLDAVELAASLRARANGGPVLIAAGGDDEEQRRRLREAGFRECLAKPVDANVLDLLLALVARERGASAPPAPRRAYDGLPKRA
jgi:CheY-like chemotaxis protein